MADELTRRNTTSPKPENRLDRKNGGAAQAVDVALPACRTNRYILAIQAEPDYMKTMPAFQHIARVKLFRRKLGPHQPLNTRDMQHMTANLTRPYTRNRPYLTFTDEASVASFPNIFMYGSTEIWRLRSLLN
jgi:hypothetical protein